LPAITALIVCSTAGCGGITDRSIPYSDFELWTNTAQYDNKLTFKYNGAEELEDVDLTIEVRYSNGESVEDKYYQGFWHPRTEKCIRLGQRFAGSVQKVDLKGTARVGQARVKINAGWLHDEK
jgi:hypothetical protein